MIFVSLVAYRDLELPKTVDEIFKKADKPDEIVVGIVNQDIIPFEYKGKYKVKVINILPQDSKGYCWCRSQCNTRLFNGEDYYMQIAPHSRLKQGFDTYFKDLHKKIGGKIVLCGRPMDYLEDGRLCKDVKEYSKPFSWSDNLIIKLQKTMFTEKEPFQVTFMMAGCVFTDGRWVKEVPYDPYLYLWGEETDISARSIEAGYKLMNLADMPVYHLYHRKNRTGFEWDRDYKTHEKRTNAALLRMRRKLGFIKGYENEPENVKYGLKDPIAYKKLVERAMRREIR